MEIRKRVGAKTKAKEEIKTRVAMEGGSVMAPRMGGFCLKPVAILPQALTGF